MKINRRRRHLRPAPSRAMIAAQLRRLRSALNLFRLEWIMEARSEQPRPARLRFLHDRIVDINDEIASVEQQ
jgi:hypothetical protein